MCQEHKHSDPETETDEDEVFEEEEEEEHIEDDVIIRAKWILDGCSSIDEIIERLKGEIEHYKQLKEDGWELREKMDDDYGFLIKKN